MFVIYTCIYKQSVAVFGGEGLRMAKFGVWVGVID